MNNNDRNDRGNAVRNMVDRYGPAIMATLATQLTKQAKSARASAPPRLRATLSKQPAPSRKVASTAMTTQSAPVASFKPTRSSQPKFVSRTNTSTRIIHRELISTVTGSSAFAVLNGNVGFPLNPGMAITFPWLSTQAVAWEQYKFRRLKFIYYSRCGTSTPGSVILAPDYDAADNAPATETIACSYRDCVEEVPWTVEFCCSLDPKGMLGLAPRKYVRTSNLASNLDIKTYDSGTMYLCTTDGTAINWGKLWVEYDIDLFIPQLPSIGSFASVTRFYNCATPVTSANPLANFTVTTQSAGFATINSSGLITFSQLGTFFLIYSCGCSALTAIAPSLSGATFVLGYAFGTGWQAAYGSGAGNFSTVINVTAVGAICQLNLTITSGNVGELFMVNCNSSAVVPTPG